MSFHNNPSFWALTQLGSLGDLSEQLVNGAIPAQVKRMLEFLNHEDLETYFKSVVYDGERDSMIQVDNLICQLCHVGNLADIRFILETLGADQIITKPLPSIFLAAALAAERPSVELVTYLTDKGCPVSASAFTSWTRCSGETLYLTRLLQPLEKWGKKVLEHFSLVYMVVNIIDNDSRIRHMQALRNVHPITADDARYACKYRRGDVIEALVREPGVESLEMAEILEIRELERHLDGLRARTTFPFFRSSLRLRRRLRIANGFAIAGRRIISFEDELDDIELQIFHGDYMNGVWQLVLLAAKHGNIENTIHERFFGVIQDLKHLIELRNLIIEYCHHHPRVVRKCIYTLGKHCQLMLSRGPPVRLVTLPLLYECFRHCFNAAPIMIEREMGFQDLATVQTARAATETAICIAIRRFDWDSSLEEQFQEIENSLDKALFIIAHGAKEFCQLDANEDSTRARFITLINMFIYRGASLQKLTGHAMSTLHLLLTYFNPLPTTMLDAISSRFCCPAAMNFWDRTMMGSLFSTRCSWSLRCLAIMAFRSLPERNPILAQRVEMLTGHYIDDEAIFEGHDLQNVN